MLISSSRLLVCLLRNSSKLYSPVNQIVLRCSTSSSVLESINQLNVSCQQSTVIAKDPGNGLNCSPIVGEAIFDQKLIVIGENIPQPWDSFDCYEWPEVIKDYLTRKGLTKPTTIQAQTWPIVFSGRDLVGISTTGSGKTLAFVLPALVHVDKALKNVKRYIGPNVVILTPTRELTQQINQVFIEIGLHIPVSLFGGAAKRTQAQSLKSRQPAILVSTPGRLNEFIDEKNVDLSKVDLIVLDEADRMLELGLEAQIRRIIDRTPKQPYRRQSLFFSATWPKEVRDLASDFLNHFVHINVGSEKLSANPSIKQNFIFPEAKPKAKETALVDLLNNLDDGTKKLPNHKLLIFVSTKKGADYLQRYLTANGFYSMAIHSDRPQHSRNLIIDAFRSGERSIMVGTDIASRGLDIDDISIVINYDMPNSVEDYVHRIGRTARSEKLGISYSLFMPDDSRLASDLVNLLKESTQPIDPKLILYARLVSKQHQSSGKMGYPRYGTPMKKRIQDKQNVLSNFRKVIYS